MCLDVTDGRAIVIGVDVHQMDGAKVAPDRDNHDVAMVNDVGAKLRLNHVDGTIDISKDTRPIFGRVEPLRVQGNPVRVDRRALDGYTILLGQGGGMSNSSPGGLLQKDDVRGLLKLL